MNQINYFFITYLNAQGLEMVGREKSDDKHDKKKMKKPVNSMKTQTPLKTVPGFNQNKVLKYQVQYSLYWFKLERSSCFILLTDFFILFFLFFCLSSNFWQMFLILKPWIFIFNYEINNLPDSLCFHDFLW